MLNQNFPIIYKGHCLMVDPSCLLRSSKKFQELIQPIINDPGEARKMQLQINYDKFSERNVENFLKLCQNLPTDCKNSEVKEVCEIAKMFQADQIYNTGLNFIHNNIDPNFNVSEDKFIDTNSYLVLSPIVKKSHHFSDINSLEFEDDEDSHQLNHQENVDPNVQDETTKKVTSDILHSKIYNVKIIRQKLKLPIYQFINNNEVVFTAKHKDNLIVIGKGQYIHLKKDQSNHLGKITMENGFNSISCDDQKFRVSFVYLNGPGTFSLEVGFLHNGTPLHWKPKKPKFNEKNNSYTLSLRGEYHHESVKSAKNTVLVNDRNESCLIIRKVSENEYEIECHPAVSQIVIFSIALSQIIGPNPSHSNLIKM